MLIDQAILLAAGFGKRLQPLTLTTPKPLLPVQGTPILAHLLDRLRQHGVKKVVVNTHYLAQQLEDYLATVKTPNILISHEPELLETGGGVLQALSHFEGHPFFCH
ncbi:nucleotidyltransferase family protein [Candidatus Paracaedibacter symbiosus]|uniref:nucleotidyltransferase family protein n=1 Tax=Candidatus Paracaedibacter symbiosus TaxID=244582 RepID=UPI00068F07FD|nr:sugar phosphate nucleotidyltransferase [Candidatus Paracaedibacter symbiosus]